MNFIKPDFNNSERLSTQIANSIEQGIINKEIVVGQKLPPEKELRKIKRRIFIQQAKLWNFRCKYRT
jgi:DNA-binding transcriptional regulator YhcF (GntR family)